MIFLHAKEIFRLYRPAKSQFPIFVPVHRNELIDIVHNLKNKKSTGHDGIDKFY